MLFGLISFRGRIGRIGWLVHLIAGGIAALGTLMMVFELIETSPRPSIAVQDRIMYAAIAVWGLIAVSFLGATIRRLRDAGSPAPLFELIAAVAIPLFGWLWLVYRLVFAGSAGLEGARGEPDEEPAAAEPETPPARRERIETRRHRDHEHEFRTQLPIADTKPEEPAVPQRTGATVTRTRRPFGPRARRKVGF